MAITNQERVGKAMNLLRAGLAPVVAREVQQAVKSGLLRMDAVQRFSDDSQFGQKSISNWDVVGLLKLMWETCNDVFGRILGRAERSTTRTVHWQADDVATNFGGGKTHSMLALYHLFVKSDVARRQLETEVPQPTPTGDAATISGTYKQCLGCLGTGAVHSCAPTSIPWYRASQPNARRARRWTNSGRGDCTSCRPAWR